MRLVLLPLRKVELNSSILVFTLKYWSSRINQAQNPSKKPTQIVNLNRSTIAQTGRKSSEDHRRVGVEKPSTLQRTKIQCAVEEKTQLNAQQLQKLYLNLQSSSILILVIPVGFFSFLDFLIWI